MPVCNPLPSSPAIDLDIPTHVVTVQPSIENALTAITVVTSLHYVENTAEPEAQQPLHTDAEHQEVDPQGQEEDHQAGHQAEVDSLIGALQGIPIPVPAPHKTITEEGHHAEEDAPQPLIGIRSAI